MVQWLNGLIFLSLIEMEFRDQVKIDYHRGGE